MLQLYVACIEQAIYHILSIRWNRLKMVKFFVHPNQHKVVAGGHSHTVKDNGINMPLSLSLPLWVTRSRVQSFLTPTGMASSFISVLAYTLNATWLNYINNTTA